MLKRNAAKAAGVLSGAVAVVTLATVSAFAAVDTAAVNAVDGAASGLKDTLVEVMVTVLPYAAALLAITVGWRIAKRFVRG